MKVHENCPDCGKSSTNTHDPMGVPKTLRCSCGNRWSVPRYIPEPEKKKRKASA